VDRLERLQIGIGKIDVAPAPASRRDGSARGASFDRSRLAVFAAKLQPSTLSATKTHD
jgi:hypothetical protein